MIRLLSGVALAGGVVALVWWLPPSALAAVAVLVSAIAVTEYARIVVSLGGRLPYWPTLAATVIACVMIPFPWVMIESVLGVTLLVIAFAVLTSDRSHTQLATDAALAMLAPVYIGVPIGSLVGIHAIGGSQAVLLLIATIAISDTAQYYTGRAFGRTLLAPTHSPKKTREGALGGFIAAPVFLVAAGSVWLPTVAPAWLAGLGVALVAAGIAGDVFESMLKRAAELKDSGTIIPGHGGVLDRIDALLFAAPIFLLFHRLV
ncbi:MAG: phosphatidate cytidylyltransferase [Vicinamibacterales bacterium]